MTAYDVIVFGATGFTGRLAAIRLASETGITFAIAGRNKSKLDEVAKLCAVKPAIIVADAGNAESVRAMVSQGRVIANFAGPFALYGEAVIAACVELGRSYCDITGESPFIAEMIERYQAKALETGACLIPMSGFDSVPSDMLAFLALTEGERHGWRLTKLTHYCQIGGGFNGGTLETALTLGEQKKTNILQNLNSLIPDKDWVRAPRTVLAPTYEPLLKRWSSLFFMHFVNASVVRRSIFLRDPENKNLGKIDYSERMLFPDGTAGKLQAFAMTSVLGLLGAMTGNALGRAFLRKIGPSAGEGPSEKSRLEGFYKGTLIGRDDEQARLMVKMKFKGDPGNEFTCMSAIATAVLLAQGKATMTGFTTPSTALGTTLIQALEARGVVFSTNYL